MNPTTFMFWDSETTGLDKAFDVPVEIGALVTDANLSPIRDINLVCRPAAARASRAWRAVGNKALHW